MAERFYISWFAYDIVCCVLIFNMYKRIRLSDKNILISLYIIVISLLSILGTVLTPDYRAYKEIVKSVLSTKDPFTHIEAIYIWLIKTGNFSHEEFIDVVYVVQYMILWVMIRFLKRPYNIMFFLAIFSTLSLYATFGGRQYLFIFTFYCGYILWIKKESVLGLLLIISSFFLHKTAILVSPLLLLSFIKLTFNKKTLIVIISSLTVIIFILRKILLDVDTVLEQLNNIPGINYLIYSSKEGGSLWWRIIDIYFYILRILLGCYIILKLRGKYNDLNRIDKCFYNLNFWTIISVIVLFSIGLPNNTMQQRLLYFGTIPICYNLAYIYKYNSKIRGRHILKIGLIIDLILTNAYILGVSHGNL